MPGTTLLNDDPANLLGWLAPWLGVVVFGIAAAAHFSAPRGALPWLMTVLLTAWIATRRRPARRRHLPAFWLLVPGAVGLISAAEIVGNPTTDSPPPTGYTDTGAPGSTG